MQKNHEKLKDANKSNHNMAKLDDDTYLHAN
jgi:hypothetical protein